MDKLRTTFGVLLGAIGLALACPFDNMESPKWNPMGKPFYLVSSFGDLQNGKLNLGIDFSTQGQPNQPVQAPETGKILEWKTSANGLELTLQGISGHKWVLSGLSKLHPKASRKPAQPIQEYDTIAYSGETLHIELHSPDGKQAINPCEMGIACHDSLPPEIVEVATWDAAILGSQIHFTSGEAFRNGCMELAPDTRSLRIALRVKDFSNTKLRAPMGLHYSVMRQGSEQLHLRETLTIPIPVNQLPADVLWSKDPVKNGQWIVLQGDSDRMNSIFQVLLRESPKQAAKHPLTLEVADQRQNGILTHFVPREKCTPSPAKAEQSPTFLFTELSQPWVDLSICESKARISLLDSNQMIVIRSLCDSVNAIATPVAALLRRWPSARGMTANLPTGESMSIGFIPLQGKPIQHLRDKVFMRMAYALPHGPTVLAWLWKNEALSLQPKGLQLRQPLNICLPTQEKSEIMFRQYETKPWEKIASKFFLQSDSTPSHCATLPVLGDLRIGSTP